MTGSLYLKKADGTIVPVGGGSSGAGSDGYTFVQDTPPTADADGQTWFDTSTGHTFVWYADGTSSQWVQDGPGAGGGEVGAHPPVQISAVGGTSDTPASLGEWPSGQDQAFPIPTWATSMSVRIQVSEVYVVTDDANTQAQISVAGSSTLTSPLERIRRGLTFTGTNKTNVTATGVFDVSALAGETVTVRFESSIVAGGALRTNAESNVYTEVWYN